MLEKSDEGAKEKGPEPHASSTAPVVSEGKAGGVVEDFPDPDEDDLDDLDDMLDEFSAVKIEQKSAQIPAIPMTEPERHVAPERTNTSVPDLKANAEDMFDDEEFAKQLQAGMADLLGELEKSPEMQAEFENIFKQIGAAAEEEGVSATPSSSSKTAEDASFQATIRRTMERMQTSGDNATAAASAEGADDFLAEMMKQLGPAGLDSAGGSEEEFSKMLVGMMESLTAKEILYEPMKELDGKFPEWLARNRDKVAADDLKRYEEQQGLVRQIVAKFEEPTFSDSNPKDREQIVDLMQKMQSAGSPPSDLVGDMQSAQDAFSADEGCNPQ